MKMDLKVLFSIVSAMTTMMAAAKVIIDFSVGTKARLKDDYRFAKEFFSDLDAERLHPLAVERGYHAIAGTRGINATDIAYLISLDKPQRRLTDYVFSRAYVDMDASNHKIAFKQPYRTAFSRRWRKCWECLKYVVLAAIALAPFLVVGVLRYDLEYLMLLIVTVPIFGTLAVNSLVNYVRIGCAEELVKEQRLHTPLIQLENVGKAVARHRA
ncbi:TPA: hypothetical protein ABHN85_13460 [Pseudomonas sp. H2]|uniref:hypothetical protein n=1 Tax=Pseudomonas TaxID=286 RepID=UPI00126A1879|nr:MULTISPECIES: hypothetical protein [Pseudomonas]MCH7301563.1 hypothetical protein [Pseudomonas capeferrum]